MVDILRMITNYCNGKKCSCCGECCTTFLPITYKEVKRIKKALKDYAITYDVNDYITPTDLYLLCPFLDMKTKLCKLHSISSSLKPDVCRNFKCYMDPEQVEKDKKYYYDRADINGHNGVVKPMELVFFDNPTSLLLFATRLKGCDTPDKLLAYLEQTGNKDVADAIRNGNIELEWSKENDK